MGEGLCPFKTPVKLIDLEAFPEDTAPKYLILDRDKKFGNEVTETLKSMEIRIKRTAFRSPWQNGVAERWVGSCRRDLLDHP